MDIPHLYQQIAADVRRRILDGELKPGERLPPVRALAEQWECTTGTVQRAYHELAGQGLISSRPGQGTRVSEPPVHIQGHQAPLRRAQLVHRAEAFLLEVLSAGYQLPELESAVQQALDRWRAAVEPVVDSPKRTLRFVGSHDLVLTWMAGQFGEIAPNHALQLSFTGSLGGLIALAEGRADLAGCHLWDAESQTYNLAYVSRILPGRRAALVTLADRRLGLILAPGNPYGVKDLTDLAQPGLRFVNRQAGSGTRVWLDAQLQTAGVSGDKIRGYHREKTTHLMVAQAVAEGEADAGLGLEAAALSYGLHFLPLAHEPYHLVMLAETLKRPPVQRLLAWLRKETTRAYIEALGGYEARAAGEVEWVD